jgi:hypothetical protein
VHCWPWPAVPLRPTIACVVYYAWASVLLIITFIYLDFRQPDGFSLGASWRLPLVFFLPVSYKDSLIGLVLGGGLLLAIISVFTPDQKRAWEAAT